MGPAAPFVFLFEPLFSTCSCVGCRISGSGSGFRFYGLGFRVWGSPTALQIQEQRITNSGSVECSHGSGFEGFGVFDSGVAWRFRLVR